MIPVTQDHFQRSAAEIGKNGDNDALPYDIDAAFVRDKSAPLSTICLDLYHHIEALPLKAARALLDTISVKSERLLAPAGPHGFRVITKLHPFWSLYLNGLALALAEAVEPQRGNRVHSYRLSTTGPNFFEISRSWRAYKQFTLDDPALLQDKCVVVQTDISSFYEHVYHHRLENTIKDVVGLDTHFALQIDRFLNKISAGRSFGLPVGGQCARVLAETMLLPIDQHLSDSGLNWHRYVDDYTLICASSEDAYASLSTLSHILADYGLSLNRIKTTFLSAKHYQSLILAQQGAGDGVSEALRELDLYFDPYSDSSDTEYERLKMCFEGIDVLWLLELEASKSEPDPFIMAQVSRALKFQDIKVAEQLCDTLLRTDNLNSFRASWSKIMRGIYSLRRSDHFASIHSHIDDLLDRIIEETSHLLKPEANTLHFFRVIRFKETDTRRALALRVYSQTSSHAIRRACIDCWLQWKSRQNFHRLRNQWQNLSSDEQRAFWLGAERFGDEGEHARRQLRGSIEQAWRLGFEHSSANTTFSSCYKDWAK